MKLTVSLEGLAALARLDAARLTARLRADLERELQSPAATGHPIGAATRPAASDRTRRHPRAGGDPRK